MAGFQNNVLPQANSHLQVLGTTRRSVRRGAIQPVTHAISAPQKPSSSAEPQTAGDTIRLVDLDNAERARLESTDAFSELVALSNTNKQSVNRRQKVVGDSTACVIYQLIKVP